MSHSLVKGGEGARAAVNVRGRAEREAADMEAVGKTHVLVPSAGSGRPPSPHASLSQFPGKRLDSPGNRQTSGFFLSFLEIFSSICLKNMF